VTDAIAQALALRMDAAEVGMEDVERRHRRIAVQVDDGVARRIGLDLLQAPDQLQDGLADELLPLERSDRRADLPADDPLDDGNHAIDQSAEGIVLRRGRERRIEVGREGRIQRYAAHSLRKHLGLSSENEILPPRASANTPAGRAIFTRE
jgi:hypothetical protein